LSIEKFFAGRKQQEHFERKS